MPPFLERNKPRKLRRIFSPVGAGVDTLIGKETSAVGRFAEKLIQESIVAFLTMPSVSATED